MRFVAVVEAGDGSGSVGDWQRRWRGGNGGAREGFLSGGCCARGNEAVRVADVGDVGG